MPHEKHMRKIQERAAVGSGGFRKILKNPKSVLGVFGRPKAAKPVVKKVSKPKPFNKGGKAIAGRNKQLKDMLK